MASEEIYNHPDDYDLEVAARGSDDLPFWLEMLAQERPRRILEIGCGTGRLTIPFARSGSRQGFSVTGLDSEPLMLERAEERLHQEPSAVRAVVKLVHGDVCDFCLDGCFDVVLMPYGVAHHLMDLDDQLAAWCRIRQHMPSGGLFAVEVTAPDLQLLAQAITGTERIPDLDVCSANGTHLRRSVATSYVPTTQQALLAFSYQICTREGNCRSYDSIFAMHVYFPREFTLLFAATGFTVPQLIGSYNSEPFATSSRVMIGLGRAV